jgi:hypothetical protein
MKINKSIVALFLGFGLFANAQITLTKADGSPINEGDVFTYNNVNYPQASLDFHIRNNASTATLVKVKSVSITNADGSGLELCIGPVCLSSIHAGNSYPNNPVSIAANSTDTYSNHVYNIDEGDGENYPMDYVFKVYQLNSSGVEVGNSVTFTYRYQPSLKTNSFQGLSNAGLIINSNIISNTLDYQATESGEISIFDMNGRMINVTQIATGNGSIALDNLQNGYYILNFRSQDRKASIKLIKS